MRVGRNSFLAEGAHSSVEGLGHLLCPAAIPSQHLSMMLLVTHPHRASAEPEAFCPLHLTSAVHGFVSQASPDPWGITSISLHHCPAIGSFWDLPDD